MDRTPEIVVAVGNSDHVEQLVRTAGDLARLRGVVVLDGVLDEVVDDRPDAGVGGDLGRVREVRRLRPRVPGVRRPDDVFGDPCQVDARAIGVVHQRFGDHGRRLDAGQRLLGLLLDDGGAIAVARPVLVDGLRVAMDRREVFLQVVADEAVDEGEPVGDSTGFLDGAPGAGVEVAGDVARDGARGGRHEQRNNGSPMVRPSRPRTAIVAQTTPTNPPTTSDGRSTDGGRASVLVGIKGASPIRVGYVA